MSDHIVELMNGLSIDTTVTSPSISIFWRMLDSEHPPRAGALVANRVSEDVELLARITELVDRDPSVLVFSATMCGYMDGGVYTPVVQLPVIIFADAHKYPVAIEGIHEGDLTRQMLTLAKSLADPNAPSSKAEDHPHQCALSFLEDMYREYPALRGLSQSADDAACRLWY